MEQAFERRPWLLPLSLSLLTIVFLRPALIPPAAGQALDGADFRAVFYPLQQYIRQTVQAGDLPLWNPHEFIGHPIAGNPQVALFYPATWFMWLVGVERGLGLSLVFHTWLAAWGMARLARSFGSSYVGALLAGIIYAMSGWAAARYYAGHYTLLVVMALIPWAMVAYRSALAHGTWQSALPGIAVFGIAVLAGHPPMMVYMVILLVSLWAYYVLQSDDMPRAAWYAGRLLAIIGLGGTVLGAALLLPAAELTAVSSRSGADLAFANTFALPPAQFLGLALPGFFGNPKVGPYYYWGADFYEELNAYAGLLPLLAIALAFRWRGRDRWYFIALVALGLVLSVGIDGALLPILVRWVPGFGLFRTPGRALFFVMLGTALLTAQLVTSLQTSSLEDRREALRPALRLWIPISAVIAFVGAIFFAGWYASASHVEPMPLRAFIVSGSLAAAGVILLGVWLALWLWSDSAPRSVRWALAWTVILVTLDAWHVAIPIITVGDVTEPAIWAGAQINVPTGADARLIAPGGNENWASVTGHLNIAGYDPLPVESYRKLQEVGKTDDPTSPVSTLLGVKYLLTTKPYDKPNFELIGIAGDGIYYRRTDPFPRAWITQTVVVEPNDDAVRERLTSGKENLQETLFVDSPLDCPSSGAETAQITQYRPNDVEIRTTGAGGVLTLSDQFYPGWRATVDGAPTRIIRADTVFRAVCVPPGDHVVRFKYRPLSFFLGVLLSAVGWLTLLVVVTVRVRSQRQRRWIV